jgi:hypothetical protein
MTEHRYMRAVERYDWRPNAFSPADASTHAPLHPIDPAKSHANASGNRSWRQRRSDASHIDPCLPPR